MNLSRSQGKANYLNEQIFQRTSVSLVSDEINDRLIFLISTNLKQSEYGGCLTNFKNRLGLKGDQDLVVLVNVTMSPYSQLYTEILYFQMITVSSCKALVSFM